MGCWQIGGEMYSEDGLSLGYAHSDDKESIRVIHAALANGISLFDTAAAYGAGHSERLLGKALKGKSNAQIVTKIGITINETTKHLSFNGIEKNQIIPAIEDSLIRLDRDCIDLLMLHINSMPVDQANQLFDELETARVSGKIEAYGWSTDFTDSVNATAQRAGFAAVEHAMNVLMDAPTIQQAARDNDIHTLIRSPLAMGLLSGKYSETHPVHESDIRATNQGWLQYYINAKPNPVFMERFLAIKDLLQSNGRSTVQGALCWLWGKHPDNLPIPGARTVVQVETLAAAVQFGPLPEHTMKEIEKLIVRNLDIDAEDRER